MKFERFSQAHPLSLEYYLRKEVYASVDQTADPRSPPRDIDEAHCCWFTESFRKSKSDCTCEMMMVYISFTVSLEGATYNTAVHIIDAITLLEDGSCMVLLDGHHQL